MTRLGFDLSILRHPYAGTARYAKELLGAMRRSVIGSDVVLTSRGLPRGRRGSRARRYLHLTEDLAWWCGGIPIVAARDRIDVWFSPANTLPLALPRPCVVTIHDANFLVRPDEYERGYRRYAELMFRHAARRADRVLTDSQYSAQTLVELLGAPPDLIRVAYPGLDHALSVTPAARDLSLPPRYALFVGQTEPHKNIGLLLDAWRIGVPSDLHLVVAGPKGRDDERLRDGATDPSIRSRVHFMGRVADDVLARLYQDAACFLFPSRTEGFGFPPLEAMARGAPTAVAESGSLPEVTGDAALRFDPDDADGLAKIVWRLNDDGELRTRLIAEGRRMAVRYRWEETARIAWGAVREVAGHG
jgi:glycosyltransferase involved in cell wall biosynthesis